MSRPTTTQEKLDSSAAIAADTAAFLAHGGQMQEIPQGTTGLTMPIIKHWSRITKEERDAKKAATVNVYH